MEMPRQFNDLITKANTEIAGERIQNCSNVNSAFRLIMQAYEVGTLGKPSAEGGGLREIADVLSNHQTFCPNLSVHRSLIGL